MSTHNLNRVLAPERIAVVGAGGNRASVGSIVLDNLLQGDFAGVVHPVNPHREAVHGLMAYPRVSRAARGARPRGRLHAGRQRPRPRARVRRGRACPACSSRPPASARWARRARRSSARWREIARRRRCACSAPTASGFLVPRLGLNASFARARRGRRAVALVSQSGALVTSILDWAAGQDIGFSTVVSAGNMLDVDFGDLIDHLARGRPHARAHPLRRVGHRRAQVHVGARAFARAKPIVAYKAGRFAASAQAAVSHTGAMAGADDVYEAAFRRGGIVRVDEIEEIFDAAELLAAGRRPRGAPPRRSSPTPGAPGVMAADALLARGGELADAAATRRASGSPRCSRPQAATATRSTSSAMRRPTASQARSTPSLADRGVDAVLTVLTPQAMTDADRDRRGLAASAGATRKPRARGLARRRRRAGGAGAARACARAGVRLARAGGRRLHAPGRLFPQPGCRSTRRRGRSRRPSTSTAERARAILAGATTPVLSEPESKALLAAYGIPATAPSMAHHPPTRPSPPPTARLSGRPEGAPAASHPQDRRRRRRRRVHEADGVRAAFEGSCAAWGSGRPTPRVAGVTVQEMVAGPGHELIIGARTDPTFGTVIIVGAGGIAAEVLHDTVLELPPLNERLARRMLERLRIWPLLAGYRGRPGVDLDLAARAADALLLPRRRLSRDRRGRRSTRCSPARRGRWRSTPGSWSTARRGARRPALRAPGHPPLPGRADDDRGRWRTARR